MLAYIPTTTQRKMKFAASFFTVAAAGSVSGECFIFFFHSVGDVAHAASGPKGQKIHARRCSEWERRRIIRE